MRHLAVRRVKVDADGRTDYVRTLRERRDAAKRANCYFWVFEDARRKGEFLEFTEGRDPAALLSAGDLYTEVELD